MSCDWRRWGEKDRNGRTCICRCYLIYLLQNLLELYTILFSPFYTSGEGRLKWLFKYRKRAGYKPIKFHVLLFKVMLEGFPWTLGPWQGRRSELSLSGCCAAASSGVSFLFLAMCERPFEHADCSVDKVAWLCTKSLPGNFFLFFDLADFWRPWETLKAQALNWHDQIYVLESCVRVFGAEFQNKNSAANEHWCNQLM